MWTSGFKQPDVLPALEALITLSEAIIVYKETPTVRDFKVVGGKGYHFIHNLTDGIPGYSFTIRAIEDIHFMDILSIGSVSYDIKNLVVEAYPVPERTLAVIQEAIGNIEGG
jgi:hypothetical protein